MSEHHCMRFALVLVAVLGASVTLGACGGSSSSSGSSSTSNASSTASTQTASTPVSTSSSSTPTTPTTTTTSGLPPCRAANLSLSFLGQQGATGHGELGFAVRNISSGSCRTYGYPGILFLDRAGAPLPTVPTHTTHDFFGQAPATALVLAPGARASFRLGVTHGINSSAGCTTAYGLQVIPPNDTATLRTAIPGGAYECATATVSPLRPGQSAYP